MVSSILSHLSVAFVAIAALVSTANAVDCNCPDLLNGVPATSTQEHVWQRYIQCDYPAGSCLWVDVSWSVIDLECVTDSPHRNRSERRSRVGRIVRALSTQTISKPARWISRGAPRRAAAIFTNGLAATLSSMSRASRKSAASGTMYVLSRFVRNVFSN